MAVECDIPVPLGTVDLTSDMVRDGFDYLEIDSLGWKEMHGPLVGRLAHGPDNPSVSCDLGVLRCLLAEESSALVLGQCEEGSLRVVAGDDVCQRLGRLERTGVAAHPDGLNGCLVAADHQLLKRLSQVVEVDSLVADHGGVEHLCPVRLAPTGQQVAARLRQNPQT